MRVINPGIRMDPNGNGTTSLHDSWKYDVMWCNNASKSHDMNARTKKKRIS